MEEMIFREAPPGNKNHDSSGSWASLIIHNIKWIISTVIGLVMTNVLVPTKIFLKKQFRNSSKTDRRILAFCSALTLFLLLVLHNGRSYSYTAFHFNHKDKFLQVNYRKDLLHTDVTDIINRIDLSTTPITPKILNQEYSGTSLIGYVSNLRVASSESHHEHPKKTVQMPPQGVIDVKGLEREGRKAYDSVISCNDLSYNSTIEHAIETKILGDDLLSLRRILLKKGDWLSKELKDDKDSKKTEAEIVEGQWFRFGGSSVWLESEQCYLVFSRVVYSRIKEKNHPHVSLVRAQAFDKDWNELLEKNIPYVDSPLPDNINEQLQNLDDELAIEDCSGYHHETREFEQCNVNRAKNQLTYDKTKAQIMSKYYMTYPTILDINFNANGDWRGPEDPHIILRDTGNTQEPVVIFNMDDPGGDGRRMFSFMPHRKIDPLMKLKAPSRSLRASEKNWTPFFHPSDLTQNELSRGSVHMIYSFSPLEIFKCSLNDGICHVVFDASTLELSEDNKFDGMRGGTQFIPLPQGIPKIAGKNIWVGFPKLHISHCGCGDIFYRPMLDVLVESGGVYHQELVVPAMDFDIDVLSWDLKSTDCMGTNILSPNSITNWDVVHQDHRTKLFTDYMTLTVSESDSLTRVVTLRGVLNYILGIYEDKEILNDFIPSRQSDDIIKKTMSCLIEQAGLHCRKYGDSHRKVSDSFKKLVNEFEKAGAQTGKQ